MGTADERENVLHAWERLVPVPAPPGVAQTARTVVLDTSERLAEAIDDLHRRLEGARREPDDVDISFSTGSVDIRGRTTSMLTPICRNSQLAALGVTWLQVGLPGDSLSHALEAIQRYGEQVIAVCA